MSVKLEKMKASNLKFQKTSKISNLLLLQVLQELLLQSMKTKKKRITVSLSTKRKRKKKQVEKSEKFEKETTTRQVSIKKDTKESFC
ncbi:MAG: hypothetical protein EBR01_10000 [Proteobacteria bacterium]|nr:hypothetical protein [Pseudomonadota bacterium]